MNRKKYLRRLGIETPIVAPSIENLRLLQRRHLLSVPFENLDIHRKRKIVLDPDRIARKILEEKRGGFCYELNSLFYVLLEASGFESKMISARVSDGKGSFGREYDHLAILTKIGGEEYLADVGFGDFSAGPLKFVPDLEQRDDNGVFLIRKFDETYFEVVKKTGAGWKGEYIFKPLARRLAEFAVMCEFHQTSPASHFTRGRVCSLMTENGRRTLTDNKFITTDNDQKREIGVNSEKEFDLILEREFKIKLCN